MLMGLAAFMEGDRAILYTSPAALAEYRSGRRIKTQLTRDAHITAFMNIEILRASIMGMLDQFKTPKMGKLGPLVSIMMDIYRGMLDESRSASYSLTLRQQGVEIGFTMEYMPGSKLARLMGGTRASALPALAVLPRASLGVIGSTYDPDGYGKFLQDMLGKFANYPEVQDFIRPFISHMMENSSGETALAILPSPGPGLALAVVGRVRSAAAARDFFTGLASRINALPFIQKSARQQDAVRFVYNKHVRTVAGQQVDTFQLEFKPGQPIPEERRASFEVLLRLFTANVVYANGYQIMVFGDTPDVYLREMIGNSAGNGGGFKSAPAWSKVNRVYGKYPKNGFFYLSLSGFIRELMELAKPFMGARAGMMGSFTIPGALYGYSFTSPGRVEAAFLVEREIVAGIARLASMMMPKKGRDNNPNPDGNDK
jgi:hypothetical protein